MVRADPRFIKKKEGAEFKDSEKSNRRGPDGIHLNKPNVGSIGLLVLKVTSLLNFSLLKQCRNMNKITYWHKSR